jgi:hypothetical protein
MEGRKGVDNTYLNLLRRHLEVFGISIIMLAVIITYHTT